MEREGGGWKAGGPAELGVLGTGRMGVRLAAMFARAGRRVLLASRDPERAVRIVRALDLPGLVAGSQAQAIDAEAVLPAIFLRDGLAETIGRHRSALVGKLVIDISNPFNADYSDFLLPWDTSSAELLQDLLPGASVVGVYKHVFAEVFDAPEFAHGTSDVLVVGDDMAAKAHFLRLAAGTPFRYLDAGPLVHARTVERLTLVTSRVGRGTGTYPRMNWRLVGSPGTPAPPLTAALDALLAAQEPPRASGVRHAVPQ